DIDLIFVYEAPGITSGARDSTGRITGSISNQEYFARLGAELIDFLSRVGPEGYLYRVDMRLRPEGSSGALAHSFAACQNYYLGRARLWERIALLKARGIAGDAVLIEQFERLAAGFAFAPTTPALLLAEVAALKERIDREVAESDWSDRELKRGRGGIREVEFIVASLQILHGEDQTQLRKRSTLEAIESLAAAGLLGAAEAETLARAYRLFRRIEHALQCMAWRQTHLLPSDAHALACLAARCGVRASTPTEATEQFEAERRQLADHVRALFEELFHAQVESPPPAVQALRLLDSECSTEETRELLAQWRVHDLSLAESLRRLARGAPTMFISAAGQRRFEQLLPALLQCCRPTPWPENAIRNFESFIQASGDPNGYYSLLDDNRSILDLLIRLFGTSTTWAQGLIGNPGWFEALVAPDTFDAKCQWLSAGLAEQGEGGAADPVARLRALRDFALLGSLRLAVRYILGLASYRETAQTLSALASRCIEAATAWAWEEVAAKESIVACDELPFAVLALGKLGRNELTFSSDLDLVFVSDQSATQQVNGPCDSYGFFARVAERLVFYLADPRAGTAPFRVDTRLRPDGAGSPLVVSLDGFRQHFDRRGELWEVQTYLAARLIAGSRQLGEQALRIVMNTIARFGDARHIAEFIRSMRQRLEQTVVLPAWAAADFKRGRGGLVDLEFIAQYLQIVHAVEADDLTRATPPEVFAKADERGWLDHATAELL
ncbi:hypothetical protein FJY63_11495, partial [Candidatus Sumerlaeota bacterium]|nr:hypothetical protein [Candidatus Sumerlaeota bacterium]